MNTLRGFIGLLVLVLIGCGGGGDGSKDTPSTEPPTKEFNKKTPTLPTVPRLDPPPRALVTAWEGAGAHVGRLKRNRWGEFDVDHKDPQTSDDVLAFSFDKVNAEILRKIDEPDQPFAVVLDQLGDADLDGFKRFNNLHILYLLRCKTLSNAGLGKIANIKSLRELMIVKEPETDVEVKEINITNDGLGSLAGMKNLEKLHIDGYKTLNDGAFPSMVGLSKLTGLTLMEMPIGNAGLKGISNFKNLRSLNLSGTKTADLKEIEGMSKLATLRLGKCSSLGDAVAPSLLKLTNLQQLDLAFTRVSDATVEKLVGLRQLRGLGVDGCDSVTQKSLSALRKENPTLLLVK